MLRRLKATSHLQPRLPGRNMGILSLAGKQCIITGATGNIGFAIAQTFASAGAAVTLVGRNESRLADKLRELATQSPNIEHGGHRAVQEGILTSADWRRIISSGVSAAGRGWRPLMGGAADISI